MKAMKRSGDFCEGDTMEKREKADLQGSEVPGGSKKSCFCTNESCICPEDQLQELSNTLPSTFTWSVMVCGPTTGGVLQRNLVQVASVIESRYTDGIMQEESSRGSSYYNDHGSLHEDRSQLAFEMPVFSKHPQWEVSMDQMCASLLTTSGTETELLTRVTVTLKAEGDSDTLNDSNSDPIISFCDISAGPTSCNHSINRDWMSWEPQSHPIVELGFTDCYTGQKLDMATVAVILRFRPT
jgi:hypothetical protein